jgi:hypothetical protein
LNTWWLLVVELARMVIAKWVLAVAARVVIEQHLGSRFQQGLQLQSLLVAAALQILLAVRLVAKVITLHLAVFPPQVVVVALTTT